MKSFCLNCGFANEPRAVKCKSCGNTFAKSAANLITQPTKSEPRRKTQNTNVNIIDDFNNDDFFDAPEMEEYEEAFAGVFDDMVNQHVGKTYKTIAGADLAREIQGNSTVTNQEPKKTRKVKGK